MGDRVAADHRRADDQRRPEPPSQVSHLPSHPPSGLQHGSPVDGRGQHAQVFYMLSVLLYAVFVYTDDVYSTPNSTYRS